jgi:hypothetical protein
MNGKTHPSPFLSPKGRGVAILKAAVEISSTGERFRTRGLGSCKAITGTAY